MATSGKLNGEAVNESDMTIDMIAVLGLGSQYARLITRHCGT